MAPSAFGVPSRDAPVAVSAAIDADHEALGWDGPPLTALLDRPTSPALSDGVQRADRSPDVLLGKWALGSVRPFADVSRSSRSFAGG
jgi:hypothetical protein